MTAINADHEDLVAEGARYLALAIAPRQRRRVRHLARHQYLLQFPSRVDHEPSGPRDRRHLRVRADGLVGIVAEALTLAFAGIRGGLVILDFMQLRHAPNPWRSVICGWLMVLTTLLMVVYALGSSLRGGFVQP